MTMTSDKKPGVTFWATVAVVVVLVGYARPYYRGYARPGYGACFGYGGYGGYRGCW